MTEPLIRDPCEDDTALVLSSWKRTVARGLGSRFQKRDVMRLLDFVVEKVVLPRCTVRVCCIDDEPSTVVAWIAVHGERLAYAYTKPEFRKLGLCRKLQGDAQLKWQGFDPIDWLEVP